MKIRLAIYAATDSLLEKISLCDNNPRKPFTSKINKHATCNYSLFTHWWFNSNKNNHSFNRDEDFIKEFCTNKKK